MIEKEQDGLHTFHFKQFEDNGSHPFTGAGSHPFMEAGRLQHAIFSRQGGVSSAPYDSLNMSVSVPDDNANVYQNRARAFGLYNRQNDSLVHAHLVHGNAVARVTQANNGVHVPHVDAIITNEPGCGLTMNFADCAPILLYDPINHAIGLGHAGWKGAIVDLPGAMVRAMQNEFGSQPDKLLAGIGPCISVQNYEVGEEVITAVKQAFPNPDTLLIYKEGAPLCEEGTLRPHFDLGEANYQNLTNAGVRHIELSGICTASRTDRFFSHRAEKGKTGRFGSIFILE